MKLFSKSLFFILYSLFFCTVSIGATNLPAVDGPVGDFGMWATPHNQKLFVNNLTDDISAFQNQFQQTVLVKDYVPVEAKVGRAFIGAMSHLGGVLENSLVRFVTVFLIALFAFWIMFESYNLASTGGDSKKLIESIIRKAVIISIWIFIIEQGPAQLFMWLMGPIITIGTMLSDLILNSVTSASATGLPDTCAAIHNYVAAHHTGVHIIDANSTADLLCVPTRLSGFFYTAVAAGWKWMLAGIGTSAFTFTAGAFFVVIFIYNIWKFALMALGVIMDLFLVVFMLPFTAIAMTFGDAEDKDYFGEKGATNYKGIAGDIFNQFIKVFSAGDLTLSKQIDRFIQAMIYFVSLSVVIALCAAILGGILDTNLADTVPTITNDGFMTTLIVGCLVAYLATKAGDFAKNLGGSINDTYTKQVSGDVKKLWDNTKKTVKDWRKAIKESKKS